MATFVLVHGAWHGGWAWQEVKQQLEQQHHTVYTPTMTGLGERQHLLSANIHIDTLVQDIAQVIEYEDLTQVILVGHSFGGTLISAVAEQLPQRIKQLIYLDAAILENGESMFSKMPPELVQARRAQAQSSSKGLTLPVPTAEQLGILDVKQWHKVAHRLTPHPLHSYDTPLQLQTLPGTRHPCHYIFCNSPLYEPLEWARKRAKHYGWPMHALNTGHDAMVTAPDKLVALLLAVMEG